MHKKTFRYDYECTRKPSEMNLLIPESTTIRIHFNLLIFCRDALQHLPCSVVVSALSKLAKAKPKFVLAGSYDGNDNHNIKTGEYFSINLAEHPYNLADGIVQTYNERTSKWLGGQPDKKMLLISGDYLSTVDFEAMRERC